MTSLRKTLLLSLLLGITSIMVLGGIATYVAARSEIDTLMDYQLQQLALSLRDQQFAAPGQERPLPPPDSSLDFVIQIWNARGVRLYLSHPHTVLPSLARLGLNTVKTSEGQWRTFSVPLMDHVIQVAQPMSVRRRLAADAAWRTLIPMLATLPLLGALIWYLVGRGLSPLQRLTREVAQRRPDALEALPVTGIPDEVRPLVLALNRLLERLSSALASQREFVADAAHELRTPLTALQIQLQLTERATDEASRKAALSDLGSGLARASHLVQQLLTLARQEPGSVVFTDDKQFSLAEVVSLGLSDHAAHARKRGIDLGAAQLDKAVQIRGDVAALRTLVGNLIDNAIRYTPEGGKIDLAVEKATVPGHAQGCCLIVDDSGPGIPLEDRQRVLNRFFRRAGTEQSGSGLGLAIVERIAERHDASLDFDDSPLGGLRVRIAFPCAGQITDA